MARRKSVAARGNRVRGHSRSPRGPNRGKPRVRVRGYKRSSPRSG